MYRRSLVDGCLLLSYRAKGAEKIEICEVSLDRRVLYLHDLQDGCLVTAPVATW